MTTVAVGNRRLLKLADILDTADAEHRKHKEPTYEQQKFLHTCGTPACALGHWAAANPRRWEFDADNYPVLRQGHTGLTINGDAKNEFALDGYQANELFDAHGCGEARTAKQAAKYIRKFVARRSAA